VTTVRVENDGGAVAQVVASSQVENAPPNMHDSDPRDKTDRDLK